VSWMCRSGRSWRGTGWGGGRCSRASRYEHSLCCRYMTEDGSSARCRVIWKWLSLLLLTQLQLRDREGEVGIGIGASTTRHYQIVTTRQRTQCCRPRPRRLRHPPPWAVHGASTAHGAALSFGASIRCFLTAPRSPTSALSTCLPLRREGIDRIVLVQGAYLAVELRLTHPPHPPCLSTRGGPWPL
jgi:hypothetical protein